MIIKKQNIKRREQVKVSITRHQMTALITETHPPALSRVPLHLLSEDINLLVSLVKLYLSFLLRYLIFSRGPLQHILLLDSQILSTPLTMRQAQLLYHRKIHI